MPDGPGTLLCVSKFPADTGYAWDHFERLFAVIANNVAAHGIRMLVAYPAIPSPPRTLAGTVGCAGVVVNALLKKAESVRATTELIWDEDVRVIFFPDRSPWQAKQRLVLHLAGFSEGICHLVRSGENSPVPTG